MMRQCCVLLLGGLAFAAEPPVARVISSQPVEVDGVTAPASNFVPLSIGGRVSTKAGVAVIQFTDGSSVTLQPNSQLQLEGKASTPEVRIVRGSAEYKMTPASRVRVSSGNGQAVNAMLDHAAAQVSAVSRPDSPIGEAVMYRANDVQGGAIRPSAIVPGGGFAFGGFGGVTFQAAGGTSGPSLITPSGLTVNLTPITDGSGHLVGYSVASLTQNVTGPNGQVLQITVASGSLVGASVIGLTGGTLTGTNVIVQFTLPGQTSPLTAAQANQSVQQALTQALNTAIANGTVPAGSTLRESPVSTGTFSSSAP